MNQSKFWQAIAVAGVCGLFYVGYGFNSDGPLPVPALSSPVYADGGVGVERTAWGGSSFIVTSLEEGRSISVWTIDHNSRNVKHVGHFTMAANP